MEYAKENERLLALCNAQRKLLQLAMDGFIVLERHLKIAQKADPADTPFGMDPEHSNTWHSAQKSAYLHALEMCASTTIVTAIANIDKGN